MTNEQLKQLIDIGRCGREECKTKDCDECSYYYADKLEVSHCLKKDLGDYLLYQAYDAQEGSRRQRRE